MKIALIIPILIMVALGSACSIYGIVSLKRTNKREEEYHKARMKLFDESEE